MAIQNTDGIALASSLQKDVGTFIRHNPVIRRRNYDLAFQIQYPASAIAIKLQKTIVQDGPQAVRYGRIRSILDVNNMVFYTSRRKDNAVIARNTMELPAANRRDSLEQRSFQPI